MKRVRIIEGKSALVQAHLLVFNDIARVKFRSTCDKIRMSYLWAQELRPIECVHMITQATLGNDRICAHRTNGKIICTKGAIRLGFGDETGKGADGCDGELHRFARFVVTDISFGLRGNRSFDFF